MPESTEVMEEYSEWKAPREIAGEEKVGSKHKIKLFELIKKVLSNQDKEKRVSVFDFEKIQEIMDRFSLYDQQMYGELITTAYLSGGNFNYQVVDKDDYENSNEEKEARCGIYLIKDKTGKIVQVEQYPNSLTQNRRWTGNENVESIFFASGQSPYFASQIDKGGLGSTKFSDEDMRDMRFLQKILNPKSRLSIVERPSYATYCVVPGEHEYKYANDSLPAIVAEEAFGCKEDHSFDVQPRVGESEVDFIIRHLESKLDPSIDEENKEKIMETGRRLASKFCTNESHIYLIPCREILDHHVSYGDIDEMRNGKSGKVELETLRQTVDNHSYPEFSGFRNDQNFNSEQGLAVYGIIDNKKIFRLKMPSNYMRLQQYAKSLGLSVGTEIPQDIIKKFQISKV